MDHIAIHSFVPGSLSSRDGWPGEEPCCWSQRIWCGWGEAAGRTLLFGSHSKGNCCVAAGWLGWKSGTSQSPSGNLDNIIFFNMCVYFWLPTEGNTVPSCHSMNWNRSTQHLSSAAQAWASQAAVKGPVKMQLFLTGRWKWHILWGILYNSFFCCFFWIKCMSPFADFSAKPWTFWLHKIQTTKQQSWEC